MNRRVLFVSTQMEAGGAQVLGLGMRDALAEKGDEARIVFLYEKRPVFAGRAGVDVILRHKPQNVLDYIRVVVGLFAYVREYRPTAIVGLAHFASPLATLAGMLAGVPKRVATQTNPPSTVRIPARVLDVFAGMVGLYTANIAASYTVMEGFRNYPKPYCDRLSVVYNGISLEPSKMSREQARESFGLGMDEKLVINCGRISAQKNQEFLIEVMKFLPDYRLIIAGDGALRPQLERAIAEAGMEGRVDILGELPRTRVADLFRCGGVFAFPSRHEAFGLAAVEAMMSGLPIVASDHPALVEIIDEAGILLPPREAGDWADAIDRMFEPERLNHYARIGYERARRFSFDAMLLGFEKEF